MSLTVKEGSDKEFKKAPIGTHIGRCYQLVELGTHYTEAFDKWSSKVLLGFELPLALIEDGELEGKPYAVARRFTPSLHPKSNLRPLLESWRGKAFTPKELNGFELKNVLGVPCMIGVVHTDDGKYANITSVMKLMDGAECPLQVNESVYFEIPVNIHIIGNQPVPPLDDELEELKTAFASETFESLSDGLKKVIKESAEWKFAMTERTEQIAEEVGGTFVEDDESIPF